MTLTTVVAGTRPGRVGGSVADWFTARASEHDQETAAERVLGELARTAGVVRRLLNGTY
ncbi:hypothetical protein [Streptomyces aurantiogriseus]|uniref:Uncharacterized protein n=1 Tax=Streptomyces aurantiogriseus TaxID=66870 RepID=A0A918FH65_9ACTN|nr:hypothetical protein [Streptomyces aurantiogriseus]GGR37356.1 hypothetical protein GCM10010251_62440 [Streptomyces aurantiogriseus]